MAGSDWRQTTQDKTAWNSCVRGVATFQQYRNLHIEGLSGPGDCYCITVVVDIIITAINYLLSFTNIYFPLLMFIIIIINITVINVIIAKLSVIINIIRYCQLSLVINNYYCQCLLVIRY